MKFIHKSKHLRWDRNYLSIKDKSLIKCYILSSITKLQPKFARCDHPHHPDRISGIPY